MPTDVKPTSPKEPSMDEIKEASDLVDEILGAPSPGKEGPPLSKEPKNLTDSLSTGKTGEDVPKVDDANVEETGSSQDMGPLVKMFGGEEEAKKAYKAGQKLPSLSGKSPSEMASALKADFQLRTRIMQDVAEEDDRMSMEEENSKPMTPPSAKDLMPSPPRPPAMPMM